MFSKRFQLIFHFYVALMPTVLSAGTHRWQGDSSIRGNSFGLENFLFQSFEDVNVDKAIRGENKIRPVETQKNENTNGQSYEAEKNLSVITFLTTRPQVTSSTFQTYHSPNNVETIKEVNSPQIVTSSENVVNKTTERSTARVVMRRRKRPQQPNPDNKTSKNRLMGSNSTFRNPSKNPSHRLKPVRLQSIITTTHEPEMSQEERVQHVEITKIAEQSTPATRIHDQQTARIQQRQTTKITPDKSATINLKDFLRQQTETLSLSELLQTQNLSLTDLLRGNKDASAIFKAKHLVSSTPAPAAVVNRRKNTQVLEPVIDASESKFREVEMPKKAVITETTTIKTTSKRLHQKGIPGALHRNYTGGKFQENSSKEKENPTESIKTTKRTSLYTLNPMNLEAQNRIHDFRSKLRNNPKRVPTKEPEVTTQVPKEKVPTPEKTTKGSAISLPVTEPPLYKSKRIQFKSSNNPELSLLMSQKKSDSRDEYQDRVTNLTSRVSLHSKPTTEQPKQTDQMITEATKILEVKSEEATSDERENSLEIETTTLTTKTTYEDVTKSADEIRKPEMKDDLIELLRSGHGAEALKRILESRNMTLQEVLENREKSTVHSNIEELFASQQKNMSHTTPSTFENELRRGTVESVKLHRKNAHKPETKVVKDSNSIVQANVGEDEVVKRYSLPIATIQEESIFNFKPDDLTADTSNTENLALWKLSDKSVIYGSTFAHRDSFPAKRITDKPKIYHGGRELPVVDDDDDDGGIILLETLEKHQEADRKLKLNLNDYLETAKMSEDIDKSYIPPAVKSAIIASSVVMGIAICVFIGILVACGWKQRQIRLKGSSSILNETLTRSEEEKKKKKRKNTSTPANFGEDKSYKKTTEFDDGTSESGTSVAGSYLWSSLKNTFTSRATTLKSRLEKDAKSRESKLTLRGNESKNKLKNRHDDFDKPNTYEIHDEKATALKKIDYGRNVINTSFNFKRSNTKDNYFNESARIY